MMLVKYNGFLNCILSKIADLRGGTKVSNIEKSTRYTFLFLGFSPTIGNTPTF